MSDVKQYQEQISKFKHIIFKPESHTYLINGREAQSVTSLLKKFVKPFERDYWANIKARQLGIEVDELLAKWEYSAKLSQTKGSIVHSYIESQLTGCQFEYPEESVLRLFGHDPIQEPFTHISQVAQQFILDIQNKMLPVASELIVGDSEYLLGGTVDQIFYNKKSAKLEIWDWKTNKEIKLESRYYHLAPLSHIPDTELDHYSLQLALYKLILERNTGIKFGNSYIVWLNEAQPKYQIFKTRDYQVEAQLILDHIS